MGVPAIGCVLLALSVQVGGPGSAHATVVDGAVEPRLLEACTVYVTLPALAEEVVHVGPVDVQLVHAYEVGTLPLHDAVSVIVVPTSGVLSLAKSEHTGADWPPPPPPPPVLLPLHSTSMPARGPCPAPFVAASA
jgi:hypothetical protein